MLKKCFIILALYLFIALVMTYPLVLNFGDHVPGSETWAHDEYSFVWSQWWIKHALFDLNAPLLMTRHVFYPLGLNLASFTMLWTNSVLGLPIQIASGIVPSTNAMVLLSFVLGAFGMYLLARSVLRRAQVAAPFADLAAILAGAAFAFTSSRMVYAALGHYTVLASQWLPFFILYMLKTLREPRWGHPLFAGLFAALAFYSDAGYVPLLVLFTVLILAFEGRASRSRVTVTRLVGMVAAATLFSAPLLIPLANEFVYSGYQLPGWGHAEELLVDAFGFLAPSSLHPLNRYWTQELDAVRQGISRFSDVNTFFVGYITILLALVGACIYRQRVVVWIASALMFASLTLGPLLHVNGQSQFDADGIPVTFPMPFLLLHYIPFLKENRVPNRYSILVMIALAILIAFAIAWASERLAAKSAQLPYIVCFAFLFFVLFEHASVPLPLTDARVPDVYGQIARDPGDFAILTLPFGLRNSFATLGAEDTRVQYYQSVHKKFSLSGNTSRNPPIQFEYFDRLSLFHSFSQVELYNPIPPDVIARDKAQASQLAALFDIRYVVVNAATPNRVPYSDTRDATLDYARQVLPLGEKIYDRDGVIAYRLNQPPLAAKMHIKFGTDASLPFQAEGWEREETIANESANWVNRREARLLIPTRDGADYGLTLRALPFAYPNAPAQTLDVTVNGQSVQKIDMTQGWENYSLTLPARALHSGVNDVILRFGYAVRPRDVVPANYSVGGTGTLSAVNILAQAGNAGSILVNGKQASKLGRGYNVVVLDARGNGTDARSFNTADEPNASRALVDFIAKIPKGAIVVGVSQEEVAGSLSDGALAALRSIGAQNDPRKGPNRAHAIIGVKGAQPGLALEQWSDGGAIIFVGQVPDDRTLAVAVSALTIERK